jgi:hypothetical protein
VIEHLDIIRDEHKRSISDFDLQFFVSWYAVLGNTSHEATLDEGIWRQNRLGMDGMGEWGSCSLFT